MVFKQDVSRKLKPTTTKTPDASNQHHTVVFVLLSLRRDDREYHSSTMLLTCSLNDHVLTILLPS